MQPDSPPGRPSDAEGGGAPIPNVGAPRPPTRRAIVLPIRTPGQAWRDACARWPRLAAAIRVLRAGP